MRFKKMILGSILFFVSAHGVIFAQVLETEESQPLLPRQTEIGTALEFQVSSEGTETAIPMEIEYGILKRLTLLVEPIFFTYISQKGNQTATGVGDLEITLMYQLIKEKRICPSISISAEVKVPTARNTLIGTTKTDFTPYMIASKKIGKFFTSVNFSYTFLGKPEGVDINNVFNYGIGTIFRISERHILFGEVYGNTSATGEGEGEGNPTAPNDTTVQIAELAGGETVGALGYGYYLKNGLLLSFGVSLDNNLAVMFRPGIEWKFGGKPKQKKKS